MPDQNNTPPSPTVNHLTSESIELRFFLFIRSLLMILVASTSDLQASIFTENPAIIKAILWAYATYTLIANFVHRANRPLVGRTLFAIDLIVLSVLFWIGSGSNVDLSHMFLFLIAFTAFTDTFKNALTFTALSVSVIVTNALYLEWIGLDPVAVRSTLIEAIYVAFVGLSLSFWGKNRTKNNTRLNFLYDLLNNINNRLGERHALEAICRRIGTYFKADRIIVITHNKVSNNYSYLSLSGEGFKSVYSQENPNDITLEALISPPQHLCFAYQSSLGILPLLSGRSGWKIYSEDPFEPKHENLITGKNQMINMMDELPFMSVGLLANDEYDSRIYVCAQEGHLGYNLEDLMFMQKIINIIQPAFSNIQLIYELIEDAEKKERERIYRDLHDRSIQPYIGLKMSLEAIKRTIPLDNPAQPLLDDTIRMTDICLSELRQFATNFRNLNNISESDLREILETIRHRYSRYFNIQTQLSVAISAQTPHRLIREIPAIIMEAMSNILRHSGAKMAEIHISDINQAVKIEIAYNEHPNLNDLNEKPAFDPKSIRQRVEDLGGTLSIYYNKKIYTTLDCHLPY